MSHSDGTALVLDGSTGERALLPARVTAERGVTIGASVVFADDGVSTTVIREGARIGAGAVLDAGVEIGRGAEIRPGAVVLASVPSNAIVQGNPAHVVGYVRGGDLPDAPRISASSDILDIPSVTPLDVGDSALYQMRRVTDLRGALTVGEVEKELPFAPRRYFIVFDVPSRELRGEHAHRACRQFLICAHGSCTVLLDDGDARREFTLDRPDLGVYVPPMIWGTQYRYSADAVLLVFASLPYDPDDYIRDYSEFLSAVGERRP